MEARLLARLYHASASAQILNIHATTIVFDGSFIPSIDLAKGLS
jgi:hypothetical protein